MNEGPNPKDNFPASPGEWTRLALKLWHLWPFFIFPPAVAGVIPILFLGAHDPVGYAAGVTAAIAVLLSELIASWQLLAVSRRSSIL